MTGNRVVITGMGAVSAFGSGCSALWESLHAGASAIVNNEELESIAGVRSTVCSKVPDDLNVKVIPRKFRRSMSRMSIYALLASYEALNQAGIDPAGDDISDIGVSVGSTIGSPAAMQLFFEDYLPDFNLENMKSSFFFKVMNHSVSSNIVMALGLRGRSISAGCACATSNQSIGLAYEMIAAGRTARILAGGSDEYHPLTTATFDVLNASSVAYNDTPTRTPRPFDQDRDGVVCSEGSGIVLLETLEGAEAAGRLPIAEVIGFATVSDPSNIAHPSPDAMEQCMRMALDDAGLQMAKIGYINAHATGTEHGDPAESEAIARVFGNTVPVSSLKGHLGHTMAASGSLELIATLQMQQNGVLIPTRNLKTPAAECCGIQLITENIPDSPEIIMKNSFAFGGVNSTLILRKY